MRGVFILCELVDLVELNQNATRVSITNIDISAGK